MLSRKLHLEQINRFHDAIENIDKQLELGENPEVEFELYQMYFKLTNKLWPKIDDHIEEVKDTLDSILNK